MCVCVFMCVCHVYVHACVYVCMCVYIYIYIPQVDSYMMQAVRGFIEETLQLKVYGCTHYLVFSYEHAKIF